MASYSRHANDLDKDLDGLSFSYLDGVPFRLDPRIEAVNNYDFSRVDSLVNRALPTPGLSEMCDNLIQKMGMNLFFQLSTYCKKCEINHIINYKTLDFLFVKIHKFFLLQMSHNYK